MKKPCSDCHTMHNSEGNFKVAKDAFGELIGPLEALMSATCAGCHTGSNATDSTPFVFSTAVPSPAYDPGVGTHSTLAGGSFYWVSMGNDLMGHNVVGVGATQVSGRLPPGNNPPTTFDVLTCAGTNGCHGDDTITSQVKSIWGSHHGPTPGTDYRYLAGISGLEDLDWEYTLAADDHNQYKGKARGADDDTDNSTISHLCAKCHGDFHSGANPDGVSDAGFASPWIRHPVDFDMGDVATGSEYAAYGDGADGIYNVSTPLASSVIPDATPGTVDLSGGANDAIITCITCHRAHGSPYDYSLRWDYKQWPGGALDGGCYDCHTVKN